MKFDDIPTLADWKRKSSSFMQIRSHKPMVVKIDGLIEKYHQVFEMARHNILMELKDAIVEWAADKVDRDAGTGRLEAMKALEAVVLKKLGELDQWGAHRYSKVVCIGYEIKTGQFENLANQFKVQYKGFDSKGLLKHDRDDDIDISGRCEEMKEAIRLAYRLYQTVGRAKGISVDEESRTLKIFMAPEFYFRGAHGAYNIEKLWDILPELRTETQLPRYRDWLFIPGSAVCYAEMGLGVGVTIDNFALVQKGGYGGADGLHDYYVEKESVSHIDFRRPDGALPHPGKKNLFPDKPGGDWKKPDRKIELGGHLRTALPPEGSKDVGTSYVSANKSERIGGCIFTMDGMTFGLEVCLDHLSGRLKNAPDKGVQIQLVTSAGASIDDQYGHYPNVACLEGGIVFNVDGGTPHVKVAINSVPGPEPVKEITGFTSAPLNLRYFSGGGKIKIYKPLPIPWPTVRLDASRKLGISAGKLEGVPVPPRPRLPQLPKK